MRCSPVSQKEQRHTTRLGFFFISTLKHVFTFDSLLFVWYTSLLGYMDSGNNEYNRQSRKPSPGNQAQALLRAYCNWYRLWILSSYQAA